MKVLKRMTFVLGVVFSSFVVFGTAHAQITRPEISQSVSTVQEITIAAEDGAEVFAVLREPPGRGPFPAVIQVHGGLGTQTRAYLHYLVDTNATNMRLLANGYAIIAPTFRPRMGDDSLHDGLLDLLAVVDYVKEMESVDANSVALFGCSAGGDLVLAAASERDVAAVVAEEPATVLFTGMSDAALALKELPPVQSLATMFADPHTYFTADVQNLTRARIRAIRAPLFIAQGDQPQVPGFLEMHDEILFPEFDAADKEWTRTAYAGEHCFGFRGITEQSLEFFDDIREFLEEHLPTQPTPVDASVSYVEATRFEEPE